MAEHARRRRLGRGWRLALVGLVPLLLAGGGAAVIVASLPQTPAAAPLPSQVFGPGLVSSDESVSSEESVSSPPPVVPAAAAAGPGPVGPRLSVPSLGIDAPWVSEPINGGTLQLPSNVHELGIWDASARLAATSGNVVVAGHVNYYNQGPGALAPLSQIRPGSIVHLTDGLGTSTAWVVQSLRVFKKTALPAVTFSTSGPRQLVLITCGGPFDPGDGSYLDNVVVTAIPDA